MPVYAVLGNHDYSMKKPDGVADHELAQRVARAMEEIGVHVLRNEAIAVSASGNGNREADGGAAGPTSLYVVGVDASWPDRADPAAALAQVAPTAGLSAKR